MPIGLAKDDFMKFKIISPLEKCFLDEDIDLKNKYERGSMLKNEAFHFSVCYGMGDYFNGNKYVKLNIVSELKDYITVKRIEHVPVHMPAYGKVRDKNYLRYTPGLYPDLLLPVPDTNRLVMSYNYESLFVEVMPEGKVAAGEYPIEIQLLSLEDEVLVSDTITVEIIDAELPKQDLIFTQWFYCDCLQGYYGTETFDEKHWEIIENFMKTAVKRGINMILTPVFTPSLDTYIGGERTTTQLVGITLKDGKYSFDFSLLERWIALCDKVGIEYFEIAHFFTQWGAKHAPKIVATVDGEQKRIFGWDTDACSEEYGEFLNAFIPSLLEFLKGKNADKRCYFHISDEPSKVHIPQYAASRNMVKDLLEGYPIIDALSDFEIYEEGIIEKPVPANDAIETFIENGVENLWVYYCCVQAVDVSNRFIAMPSARNRIMGMQLYKYNIEGFLQWGYNFFNNQYSYAKLNPFTRTDGEYFVPSGDTHSVYPAPDGTAYESLRLVVFYEGLQDLRALKLCEKLCGREKTMQILEEGIEPITFKKYPHSADWLLNVREKINEAIKNAI